MLHIGRGEDAISPEDYEEPLDVEPDLSGTDVLGGERDERPGVLVPEPRRDQRIELMTEGIGILERFMGEEPEVILPKLIHGDPLHLESACALYLRREFLLMDPQRLFEEAVVEVAADAALCTFEDLHPDWLDASIRRSCQRIMYRDAEELALGDRAPPESRRYEYMYQAFCVPADQGRRASVMFNALPLRARRTFFALFIEDLEPDEAAARGVGTYESMRYDAWDCLEALQIVTAEGKKTCLERIDKRLAAQARRDELAKAHADAEQQGEEDAE